MNGIDNPIVFYPVAFFMILFAFMSIRFRNIFYSLLSAMGVFFLAALLFYVLGSEYNAVIQIAIYGIAVPVVLGLAIMFTNLKKDSESVQKKNNADYFLFFWAVLFLLMIMAVVSSSVFDVNFPAEINSRGVISIFAKGLFVKYVLAFELISVVLTLIIAGLTLLVKDNKKNKEELCKK